MNIGNTPAIATRAYATQALTYRLNGPRFIATEWNPPNSTFSLEARLNLPDSRFEQHPFTSFYFIELQTLYPPQESMLFCFNIFQTLALFSSSGTQCFQHFTNSWGKKWGVVWHRIKSVFCPLGFSFCLLPAGGRLCSLFHPLSSVSFCLFALFYTLVSFVFSIFQPLLQKEGGEYAPHQIRSFQVVSISLSP